MGVENKVFIEINAEDERKVLAAVCKKVNEEVRKELDRFIKEETEYLNRAHYLFSDKAKEKAHCTNGVDIETGENFLSHRILFTYKKEKRMLFAVMDCEVGGENGIIFSVNHWGEHKEIMQWVVDACKEHGKTWQKENDSKDEWEQIQ